ncbi:MAG: flippase-like domain-containing protein [Paludibacteraceae bacterium]|nr:flippase-like domain-containing protein [Paludibacteraceae bacterium]
MGKEKTKKEKAKKVLQIVGSLFLSFFIFYLVYKDQDPTVIREELKQCNLFWILISIILGALSHFVRALRWNQLIEPLGKSPKVSSSYIAVMIGYFANYLIPRAGEMARCGVLKKTDGISFSTLLGTVIAERFFDLIVLLLFVGAAIFSQLDLFTQVFASGTFVGDSLLKLVTNPFLWIAFGVVVLLIFLFRERILNSTFFKKIVEMLRNIADGIKTFFKVKNKPLFILYTLIIWVFYFNMTYLSFKAFEFTQELTVSVGLSTFAIGSMGIVAPVQGGIGAWHFLTSECLKFYGIEEGQALTFAFVVHLAQTLMILVIGAICFLSFSILQNKNKKREP